MRRTDNRVAVIGAGIAGLASAIRLRQHGLEVDVYEQAEYPGGKLAEFQMDGFRFDAGPSLFTMPYLIDELFQLAGKNPKEYFDYESLEVICQYFYEDGTQLSAYSDPEKFASEVEKKTQESASSVRQLLARSEELYNITSHVFLERSLHKLSTYLRKDTIDSMLKLHKLDAFRSMHKANEQMFKDPRVVQLFDRYATYNGSNPFKAPATLSIIPHLEYNMGAYFPKGGMYSIPKSLHRLATDLGVRFHFDSKVNRILYQGKQIKGVEVNGEKIDTQTVVSNMDVVPTYRKLLPDFDPPERILRQSRSSSALVFYWGVEGNYDHLSLHNIFFSKNYEREFDHIWQQKTVDQDPTIYINISSKQNPADAPANAENWFVMINTPADEGQDWEHIINESREHIIEKLSRMLNIDLASRIVCERILDPRLIASRTSSFQGALYGNSSNSRFSAFLRHANFSSKLKGLYFCGGSVHPGGGIPLCLLSAKIVSEIVIPAAE